MLRADRFILVDKEIDIRNNDISSLVEKQNMNSKRMAYVYFHSKSKYK